LIQAIIVAGIVLELIALFAIFYIRFAFSQYFYKKFSLSSANIWALAYIAFTLAFVCFDALAWRPHWSWGRFAAHVFVFVGFCITAFTIGTGFKSLERRIRRRDDRRTHSLVFYIFAGCVVIRVLLALVQFCLQAQRTMSLRAILYGR
jgi:hypothetical protein